MTAASALEADLVVIGAGTAGLSAFHAADRSGRSALLVDGGTLGTMCARVGCMPSKAVLIAARKFATAAAVSGPPGRDVADRLWRSGLRDRESLVASAVRLTEKRAGDRLVRADARFVGPDTIEAGGRLIRGGAFVVATGSHPVVPDALRALGDRVLTTDTLFDLAHLPASIGVMGLGALGLEMGLALARLGVRVVAGDPAPAIAGLRDPEIDRRARDVFGREIDLAVGADVSARAHGDGVALHLGDGVRHVDRVLAALGRRPTVDALDLAAAGVRFDEHGHVRWDAATTRCGDTRVFLAGDVSPDRPLQHEAVDEGMLAIKSALAMLDGRAMPDVPRRVPLSIAFGDPDVVQVGRKLDDLDPDAIVIGTADGGDNGRAHLMHADGNLVRVYVDRETRRIEGAALVATRGEHLGHLLAWAIHARQTVDDLLAMPAYHPTIEEMLQAALKNAARSLKE